MRLGTETIHSFRAAKNRLLLGAVRIEWMEARHARRRRLPHTLALVAVLLASLLAGGGASGATTAPTFARADYPIFGNNYVVGDFNGDGTFGAPVNFPNTSGFDSPAIAAVGFRRLDRVKSFSRVPSLLHRPRQKVRFRDRA